MDDFFWSFHLFLSFDFVSIGRSSLLDELFKFDRFGLERLVRHDLVKDRVPQVRPIARNLHR